FPSRIALRAFNRNRAIAEVLILKYAADRHTVAGALLELTEQPSDVIDVFWTQFLPLAAQALAHLLPKPTGIDELQLAFTVLGFTVTQNPHVSADAGVVEHVGRQSDNRLNEVILQHVA